VINLIQASLLSVISLFSVNSNASSPNIEHWETENGVGVYFVMAPEIPMFDVRIVFAAGSSRDGAAKGIANMTNGLLKEGAGALTADTFSERFSATGARMRVGLGRDTAWASLRTLSNSPRKTQSLDLFIDAVSKPRFDETAIRRLRAQTLVALRHKKQSPGAIATEALYRGLYGDHPYGSPLEGEQSTITSIKRADILEFHKRYYVARNAVIALVGAVDRARAEEIARALSNRLVVGEKAKPLPATVAPSSSEKYINFPSIQSHVRVGTAGMRRGDPDYFPLLVGNHVLGGSSLVSILFREIRSERGLSYSVYSYFMPMAKTGPFVAALQTDRSQQEEAVKILKETMGRFVTAGPTEDALNSAKENLIGGFPLRVDSNAKIVEYLAMIGFYELPLNYLDTFTTNVAEVSRLGVKDAFIRRVNVGDAVTIVVGAAGAKRDD